MLKFIIHREYIALLALLVIFLGYSNTLLFVAGIAGLFIYVFIKAGNKIVVKGNFLFLLYSLLLFFLHGFINSAFNVFGGLMVVLPSIVLYLTGVYFVKKYKYGFFVLFLLLLVSASMAGPHIFYTLIDIFQNGLINPQRYLMILDDEIQRNITQRTIEISLCIGAIGFIPLWSLKKELQEIWMVKTFVVLSVIAALCAIHYVSRTGAAIFLFSFLIGSSINNHRLKTRRFYIVVVFIIIIAYVALRTDVGSVFMGRQEGTVMDAGGRTEKWYIWLNLLMKNPLGIKNIANYTDFYGYAHNLWLDYGKYGGLLSFLLLIIFSFKNILRCFRLSFKIQNRDKVIKQLCFLFAMVFFMSNMTEPILEGARLYWFAYCFYCGITDNY